MNMSRLGQLLCVSLNLAMLVGMSNAASLLYTTPGTVTSSEGSFGTAELVYLEVTEELTLVEDNGASMSGPNSMLREELEDKWGITTICSVSTGGDVDKAVSWSWLPIQWTWVVMGQLIVGTIGIIGNLLVIIILFQRRAKIRSTDTLIGALAVADFLTSVGLLPLPNTETVPDTWLAQIYCRLIASPAYMWVWAFLSGFVLTAISVERYIAVTHPIYFNRILTRQRVSVVVVFLWICAVMACVPGIFVVDVDNVNHQCALVKMSFAVETSFMFYVTFVQVIIPAVIMAVTQTLIAVKLKAQSKRFEGSKSYHLAASRSVIKLMLIVIIAYIVCWAPNRFYLVVTRLFRIETEFRGPIIKATIVLTAVNSSINPIIYSIRYKEFRQAVNELFAGKKVRASAVFGSPINVNTDSTNDTV